jgi:hypothetical protein
MRWPIVKQYAIMMDDPVIRLLVMAVRIVVADDVHEMNDAIAAQHHKRQIEGSVCAENRHQKIERMMNLNRNIDQNIFEIDLMIIF